MHHTFKSISDAIAAGYVHANGQLGEYRGCKILARDTSGPHSIGYSYGVSTAVPASIDGNMCIDIWSDKTFGESVKVWSDDKNRVGNPGSFCVMFDPTTLAASLQGARDWIDAFYAANPAAASRLLEHDAMIAASNARHAAKRLARQEKVAARNK